MKQQSKAMIANANAGGDPPDLALVPDYFVPARLLHEIVVQSRDNIAMESDEYGHVGCWLREPSDEQ